MINYSHIGFLALKIIAFLILLLGYFMNSQQLNKAQQDKGSPLFVNKKDYFYKEFKRVILIVDEQFKGFDINDVYYHIDSQFSINYDILYNTVIHGISPIAQLQYWNIQYKTLDSITYQIQKHNKTSYVSSYKPYIDFDQYSKYLSLHDGKELVDKIKQDDFAFLYVDNLQLSSMEYDELLSEIDSTTMLMILRFDKVYFKTNRVRLSVDPHTSTMYSIDSLTSTISCLLDLPIPLENHGIMLPGLLYETKETNDTSLMQINDYMMNLYQLYEHYSIIEKKKSLSYQSDLDSFSEQFKLVMENSKITQVEAFLISIVNELRQLSAVINSEISGNILVMILSLLLGIYTIYLVFFKVQELTTLDWQVIGVAVIISFIEMKLLKIILFIILLARMRQPMLQSILGLLLLIASFPFYQITWIGSIIYLCYKNQNFIKPVLFGVEKETLGQWTLILILGVISQYFSYLYFLLVPLIIFIFKKTELIIVVICVICRLQNALPIILLSTQYFRENEHSYFHFPAYLIIDILYITLTNPVFPSNPGIVQFEVYWHILDIVGLMYCQQMFYHLQVRMNESLEISGKTIITHLQGLGECVLEEFDTIILMSIVEIVWIVELIIAEIMSSDMKTIGSQYFTLQFISLNLIILGLYLVRETFKRPAELLPQDDDFQNTELKEIEI